MHQLSFTFKRAHWSAVRVGLEVVASVPGMTPSRFDLMHCVRLGEIEMRRRVHAERAARKARGYRWATMGDDGQEDTGAEDARETDTREEDTGEDWYERLKRRRAAQDRERKAYYAAHPEALLAIETFVQRGEDMAIAEAARIRQSDLRRMLGVCSSSVSKMISRLVKLGWLARTRIYDGDRRTNIIELTELGRRVLLRACKIVFGARTLLRKYEGIVARYFRPKTRAELIDRIGEVWLATSHIAKDQGDTSTLEYAFGWKEIYRDD